MPAFVNDAVFDVALTWIKNNANALHIVSGAPVAAPTTVTEVTQQSLATIALIASDITVGNATPDGRGVTVVAKNGVNVTGSGEPIHYCLVSGSGSTPPTILIARAEVDVASPDLTSGSTVNIPAVTFEIGDAVTEA